MTQCPNSPEMPMNHAGQSQTALTFLSAIQRDVAMSLAFYCIASPVDR